MPRLPEFDRQEVLDSALSLFWSDGYEASSISKLLNVMNLNRGSLYSSFGSKAALFSTVLDHYMAYLQCHLFNSTLVSAEDPCDAITAFFDKAFFEPDQSQLANGCLFFNAISELSNNEPELAGKARESIHWIRQLFYSRLVEAKQLGKVDSEQDIEGLSDYLIALVAGLRTLCKSGADAVVLRRVIDAGLSTVFTR
jgi:TetR/AcrR family transcriptional repressor of nem operon